MTIAVSIVGGAILGIAFIWLRYSPSIGHRIATSAITAITSLIFMWIWSARMHTYPETFGSWIIISVIGGLIRGGIMRPQLPSKR